LKAQAGQRFIDFMLSAEGQRAIAGFRREGQQLFHPASEQN
jgi:tungstate transport system substrate-binding protein